MVRNGDTVDFGDNGYVLQCGFDDWRLQPGRADRRRAPRASRSTSRRRTRAPTRPREVGGDVQVGVVQRLQLLHDADRARTPTPAARRRAEQFAIQKSKIVAAINGLDAEIVVAHGDRELDQAAASRSTRRSPDLVDGLNEDAGSEVWDYVPPPTLLNDAAHRLSSRTRSSTRRMPSPPSATAPPSPTRASGATPASRSRRRSTSTARVVTVVANHFKSKSAAEGGGASRPTARASSTPTAWRRPTRSRDSPPSWRRPREAATSC